MQYSPYLSPRPEAAWDASTVASFERLYSEAVEHGQGQEIEYSLNAPRWQFLCYLSDTKNIVLHGSGNAGIEEFEPRQSNDAEEFGNRRMVYAASDGIWPIYFAVADRDNYKLSLVNACASILQDDGSNDGPYYFFSLNDDALIHKPWRTGMVYILPRDTFEPQPLMHRRGFTIKTEQWASPVAVKPLAKLRMEPEDFPFLSQVYSHNFDILRQRIAKDPDGFPWVDE